MGCERLGWLLLACALAAWPMHDVLLRRGILAPSLRDAGFTQGRLVGRLRGAYGETRGSASRADTASSLLIATGSAQAPAQSPRLQLPDPPSACDLAWRPGLSAHVPRGSERRAWLSAEPGSQSLARLEGFFEKLRRGETVTVYFLGDSVTRGSGASHGCLTCDSGWAGAVRAAANSSRPLVHPWLDGSPTNGVQAAATECPAYDAVTSRGGDPYAACATSRAERCRSLGKGQDASESHAAPNASGAELSLSVEMCYPRNSWRCLVVQWLQHGWPGQVRFTISSKPLLFMAACFGRALGGVDLILHEQAVNGGGRMLCLQERILHAALARREQLAVLMLLWLPKTYHPTRAPSLLRSAQHGLAALAAHYSVPTLAMTRAFAARCAPGEAWCYDRAHRTADTSLGPAGSLHADLNHPNDGGHALLAAHVHALFEQTAAAVGRRLDSGARAAARPEPPPLPTPLYPVNLGLGLGSGGVHAHDDGGLCLDVAEMEASATRNRGWAVTVEVTKSKVARLPALHAESADAEIEWELDVRGADWLIITYMQSYAGFGAIEVTCASGCECRPHSAPGSTVALINATEPSARFSEPQWSLLDLSRHSAHCRVSARSVSGLKFKLMLLSLIRVRPAGIDDADAASVALADAGERKRRDESLRCFGIGGGFAVNGRVRTTAPWEALTSS